MDTFVMYTIKRMPEFDAWFATLVDQRTRQRLVGRLRKAQLGNLGDIKALGLGVYEMREHFGPGWRLYYLKLGVTLIVMLGGGDKSSQVQDIAKAMKLASQIEE
jgi:putative addiction module killer protein